MLKFSIIVAVDTKLGIGKSGNLPWHLPADMKYFKTITTRSLSEVRSNAVIMGRKTWESIPDKFRPLPGRLNVVISRQPELSLPQGVLLSGSLDNALELLAKRENELGETFVIGGAQVFAEAVKHPACQKIYLTQIDDEFFCDTFFPDFLQHYQESSRKGPVDDQGITLFFLEYIKKTP